MDTCRGDTDVVTGAFSYSGGAIAAELAARGRRVRTLTGRPERAPADSTIEVRPLDFDDPTALVDALTGADTLYNTYWIRFPHGDVDHDVAVARCRILFEAAARAGVQRIVHFSVLHPSPDSPHPYFRGKAQAEAALAGVGVPYAIVRPALLFGGDGGGALLNNLAWLLRRLPVFAVGGRGDYRVRPVHVGDLARLCVDLGAHTENVTLDAVGPDRPRFRNLVDAVRAAVGSRALVVPVPEPVLLTLATLLGAVLRDPVLTTAEYRTTAAGLADSDAPAVGTVHLRAWIAAHGAELGHRYTDGVGRRYRTGAPS